MAEISLALGGGGVKGIAHLGVLQKLNEEGYKIRAIAGTSAGGVAGALAAAGIPQDKIEKALLKINNRHFFSRLPDDGPSLLGLRGLVNILTEFLHNRTFEDLDIPFAVTAVDMNSKNEYILNTGPVIDAILATVAIPGVFPPKKIGHTELVDGGVLDPVPVAVARWLAPKLPVIAVCLSPEPEKWSTLPGIQPPPDTPIPHPILEYLGRLRIGQAIQIFIHSMDIADRMIAELRMQIEKPDVIIRPNVHHVGFLDRVDPQELIAAGRKAVEDALPKIRQSLAWYHHITRQFTSAEPPGRLLDEEDLD